MKKAREFHSCDTFEYQSDIYIIVVGGFRRIPYEELKTTEILNIKDTNWFNGKKTNFNLIGFSNIFS